MAIPLYVPEEYGPVPQASSGQPCSDSQIRQLVSRRSFLQKLIVELCSIHQEHCAASAPSRVNPPATDPDVNNNTNLHLAAPGDAMPVSRAQSAPSSSRRRRHPAGKNGFPNLATCLHDLMEPLITAAAPNNLASKSLMEDCACLGFQLREIADSYAQTASRKEPFANYPDHHARRSQSKTKSQRPRRRFTMSSLFAVAAATVAAAAAIVFIKRK